MFLSKKTMLTKARALQTCLFLYFGIPSKYTPRSTKLPQMRRLQSWPCKRQRIGSISSSAGNDLERVLFLYSSLHFFWRVSFPKLPKGPSLEGKDPVCPPFGWILEPKDSWSVCFASSGVASLELKLMVVTSGGSEASPCGASQSGGGCAWLCLLGGQ